MRILIDCQGFFVWEDNGDILLFRFIPRPAPEVRARTDIYASTFIPVYGQAQAYDSVPLVPFVAIDSSYPRALRAFAAHSRAHKRGKPAHFSLRFVKILICPPQHN